MRASLISYSLALSLFSSASKGESFQSALEKILTLGNHSSLNVSAEFRRVQDEKLLFSLNSKQTLIPASTTKLVLNAALLSKLSPTFRMHTNFYRTGELKNGIVHGDLVVAGGGDPLLVSEELFLIASEMRLRGYKEFTGDLVIDNSLFEKEVSSEGQNKNEACVMRAYDAPVSALAVNFNTLTFAVAPASVAGEDALASLEPFAWKGLIIKNEVKTLAQGLSKIELTCSKNSNGALIVTLSGHIVVGSPVIRIYRSLPNAEKLAGEYIQSFLNTMGISIRGRIREGFLKENSKLILSHESKALSDLVRSLGLYSNNFMADAMLKRMAVFEGRTGNFVEGVGVLASFLNTAGIQTRYVLKDGSGLSNQTRLSAEQLIQILLYAARDFRIFPDYLASLPIGGESGSLKNRFQFEGAKELRGNLRAKTGTLSDPVNVSALAGYFQDPSLGLISFVIIQNGKQGSVQPNLGQLHESQEKALVYFAKNYKGHSKNGL